MGRIVCIAEWFLGHDTPDYNSMLHNALRIEPDNLIYQQTYYDFLDWNNPDQREKAKNYYQHILVKDSPTIKALQAKGSLGEYVLELMIGCGNELIYGKMITTEAYEQWLKELGIS
jgi:hypothetical protein